MTFSYEIVKFKKKMQCSKVYMLSVMHQMWDVMCAKCRMYTSQIFTIYLLIKEKYVESFLYFNIFANIIRV